VKLESENLTKFDPNEGEQQQKGHENGKQQQNDRVSAKYEKFFVTLAMSRAFQLQ